MTKENILTDEPENKETDYDSQDFLLLLKEWHTQEKKKERNSLVLSGYNSGIRRIYKIPFNCSTK